MPKCEVCGGDIDLASELVQMGGKYWHARWWSCIEEKDRQIEALRERLALADELAAAVHDIERVVWDAPAQRLDAALKAYEARLSAAEEPHKE